MSNMTNVEIFYGMVKEAQAPLVRKCRKYRQLPSAVLARLPEIKQARAVVQSALAWLKAVE